MFWEAIGCLIDSDETCLQDCDRGYWERQGVDEIVEFPEIVGGATDTGSQEVFDDIEAAE